ncbi:MAG: hypothetical protein ACTSW1_00620 [Candidatus Hodarchaeales archaeon]
MNRKDDLVSRIQEEMGIEERKVHLAIPRRLLSVATDYEKEREQRSVLMNIGKIISSDIEEIKMDVGRMSLALEQLKTFSKKLKEGVEKPLAEAIQELRKRKKVLATDAALTEKKILQGIDTFDALSDLEMIVEKKPETLHALNVIEQFKEQKAKTKEIKKKKMETTEIPKPKPPKS